MLVEARVSFRRNGLAHLGPGPWGGGGHRFHNGCFAVIVTLSHPEKVKLCSLDC